MAKKKSKSFVRQILDQIKAQGLPEPMLEHRFHPVRRWRFDFAWPGLMIALEYEGNTWIKSGSRHTSGTGFRDDCIKYSEAAILGWIVIRVTADMAKNGKAIDLLTRAIEAVSA